jgi:hypothetical protein
MMLAMQYVTILSIFLSLVIAIPYFGTCSM